LIGIDALAAVLHVLLLKEDSNWALRVIKLDAVYLICRWH
jgi:hypothetical protein